MGFLSARPVFPGRILAGRRALEHPIRIEGWGSRGVSGCFNGLEKGENHHGFLQKAGSRDEENDPDRG